MLKKINWRLSYISETDIGLQFINRNNSKLTNEMRNFDKMKKMKNYLFLLLIAFLTANSNAQTLKNGPMLGYLAMRETAVWVQTTEQATVVLRYWDIASPSQKMMSPEVKTSLDHAYTAHLIAGPLSLGTTYNYEIVLNGKVVPTKQKQQFATRSIWKWRTDAPDFTFLAGSCNYINETQYDRPGKPYGDAYQIFENMAKDKGDFMVWLGDNTYLREPDWDSKSGIHHRYTHTRSTPEMQALLANKHNYAIWDDHDYGPNDSERSFYLKNTTLQTFKDFWANQSYGAGESEGITGFFDWADCDFYLMDDRWYRTPQGLDGEMLGEKQVTWLIESLRLSFAKYKFICIGSQVLNGAKTKENLSQFVAERDRLIKLLDQYNIKGVIFLTGDRHHSEVSKITTEDGDVFYDVTISPLTAGPGDNTKEPNGNRIPNSIIIQRNYAQISVEGKGIDRQVLVVYKDSNGKELSRHTIKN